MTMIYKRVNNLKPAHCNLYIMFCIKNSGFNDYTFGFTDYAGMGNILLNLCNKVWSAAILTACNSTNFH